MNDFFAAITFMQTHPNATGKVGITGFAMAVVWLTLQRWRTRNWRVPFPFMADNLRRQTYPELRPILLHYAELDKNINDGWATYEAALKLNNKVYEAYIYPGVNHGFHNDSTPRYDEAAAGLAWQRTLSWFEKYLS
jgi:carboxymethylenebutenolidase